MTARRSVSFRRSHHRFKDRPNSRPKDHPKVNHPNCQMHCLLLFPLHLMGSPVEITVVTMTNLKR